jgi:hypothetical protein
MSPLRPLDPAFPIQRQIVIDAAPVVLVNVFTLDKADERTFLEVWRDDAEFMKRQPGFISTQRDRREPDLSQHRRLGVDRRFSGGVRSSRVRGETLRLSVLGRRDSASFPEGRGPRRLRRLAGPWAF